MLITEIQDIDYKNFLKLDYYSLLDLTTDSDENEIIDSYRSLFLTLQFDDSISDERDSYLERLSQAYLTLTDSSKRQAYDTLLEKNATDNLQTKFYNQKVDVDKVFLEGFQPYLADQLFVPNSFYIYIAYLLGICLGYYLHGFFLAIFLAYLLGKGGDKLDAIVPNDLSPYYKQLTGNQKMALYHALSSLIETN